MRSATMLVSSVAASVTLIAAAMGGCAGGTDTDETNGTTTPTTTTTTTTTTAAGGSGGSTGTGGSDGGSGTGGEVPDPCTGAAGHLLISEVNVAPSEWEFVEIWNPGTGAVDLSNYYLSDNSTYYRIAQGQAWAPITDNPMTDYLVQFPSGTSLAAGETLVLQAGSGDFNTKFSSCPDYVIANASMPCGTGTVPPMVGPTNGRLPAVSDLGTLASNSREMLVLFCWGGSTQLPVHDVDYVTWGATFEDGTRVDKTGIDDYAADTAPGSQSGAPATATPTDTAMESIARCDGTETGETTSGGNGISGHDETSENMTTTFVVQCGPNPGASGCPNEGACPTG